MNRTLQIGDRVIINSGNVIYGKEEFSPLEFINKTGTIVKIRQRYQNTPNEYSQYQIHIDGYNTPIKDSLDFLFNNYDIIKI